MRKIYPLVATAALILTGWAASLTYARVDAPTTSVGIQPLQLKADQLPAQHERASDRIETSALRGDVEAVGFKLVGKGDFWRLPAGTRDFTTHLLAP
jgi:hypothetical protein